MTFALDAPYRAALTLISIVLTQADYQPYHAARAAYDSAITRAASSADAANLAKRPAAMPI